MPLAGVLLMSQTQPVPLETRCGGTTPTARTWRGAPCADVSAAEPRAGDAGYLRGPKRQMTHTSSASIANKVKISVQPPGRFTGPR